MRRIRNDCRLRGCTWRLGGKVIPLGVYRVQICRIRHFFYPDRSRKRHVTAGIEIPELFELLQRRALYDNRHSEVALQRPTCSGPDGVLSLYCRHTCIGKCAPDILPGNTTI